MAVDLNVLPVPDVVVCDTACMALIVMCTSIAASGG